VGAQINPEGLNTTYEVKVECRGSGATCEPLSNAPHEVGVLPASFGGQEVSLNVTSLEPGTYWFSVLAQNSLGVAYRRSNILDIPPPPPGACPTGCPVPSEPYKPEIPPWVGNTAAEGAARELAAAQAEQRQAAIEREERQASEAAVRSAEEAALRQREAEALDPSEAPAHAKPRCIVPALRGHSIAGARRLLRRSDCALGTLRVRNHGHGLLRVVGQSVAAGARRPAGTHVAIVLALAAFPAGSM
jgi:hypothetical protein